MGLLRWHCFSFGLVLFLVYVFSSTFFHSLTRCWPKQGPTKAWRWWHFSRYFQRPGLQIGSVGFSSMAWVCWSVAWVCWSMACGDWWVSVVGLKWFFLLVCFWQFSRGCSCYGLWVWWWWQSTWIDGGFLFNFLFWDCCDLLGKGFGFIVAVIGFVLWVIVTGQRMGKWLLLGGGNGWGLDLFTMERERDRGGRNREIRERRFFFFFEK